jgi:hypothetical protein
LQNMATAPAVPPRAADLEALAMISLKDCCSLWFGRLGWRCEVRGGVSVGEGGYDVEGGYGDEGGYDDEGGDDDKGGDDSLSLSLCQCSLNVSFTCQCVSKLAMCVSQLSVCVSQLSICASQLSMCL